MPTPTATTNDPQSQATLIAFPSGLPKPHESRRWSRSLQTVATALKLNDTMRRKIPAGKFDPLWGKDQLMDPPALPEKATYKDVLAYRQMNDTIQRRKDTNKQTIEARNAWWRTSNSEYFQVITDSMLRTT